MTLVVVERVFDAPVEFAAIQAIEDRGAWCLTMHGVRFLRTWFSKDRLRMVCLYEAPDAESVRIAQRTAGMPVRRVWAAALHAGGEEGPGAPGGGPGEIVVVERSFAEPLSAEAVGSLLAAGQECLPRHDVTYVAGHLAADGRRMICVFRAPDAESVRIANRRAGVPFDRAWTATLHAPAR